MTVHWKSSKCELRLYFHRTPVVADHISSPGKLDAIIKSLVQNSPKPLMPVESMTPPASQGFSTCSEDTDVQKAPASESPLTKAGDFSSLEFGDGAETKESLTPVKEEVPRLMPLLSDPVEMPQKQDTRSQNLMQTFGYQQRMNFNLEHGFNAFHQKPPRNKKKKKKWNQMQNYLQQQGRNIQGQVDNNYGNNYNINPPTNFGAQQGMTQWRGPSQNAPPNYHGNQFYCGGPNIGLDQGPRPQHMGPGNFVGNYPQQGPSMPNFNVPPPNIPPMDFFRKVPPPNFSQQNQPMLPQQPPQQTPHIPPQSVPPPPLQGNQSQFFSPSQPSPYTRLPPPPPFQGNVSTPPSSQFPQSNTMQQQHPRSVQPSFPPQQNPYSYNSPPPHIGIPPAHAQQISSTGAPVAPPQHQAGLSEEVPHPEVASFSLQTGAVTTSSSETYKCREGFPPGSEPCTPSPVKHQPTHLPPHWKSATDQQGKVYYYHALTR